MAKFVLGLILGITVSSFAVVQHPDGSMTLDRGEIDEVRRDFYQLRYNFDLAVQRIGELTKENELLKTGKCI